MWIKVNNGEVFEGNEYHWDNTFFSISHLNQNTQLDLILSFCDKHNWLVEINCTHNLH